MKLRKISLAIAAVCSVASMPAFALPASDYTNTDEVNGDTLNIRISGATAVDPGVSASSIFLCDPAASIHRYSVQNNAVVFCQIDQAKLAGTGRTKLAVYKHSIGGSGGGVANVNNGTNIAFVDLAKVAVASNCNAGVNVTTNADVDGTNPLPAFVDTLCAGASNSTLTTSNYGSFIGVSDVEPAFFGAAAGTYNNLAAEALTSVLFGAPVTRNVYIALQKAQNLAAGFGGTCPLDDQSLACLPSLSQGQLTAMYTQDTTWPQVAGVTILDSVTGNPVADQRVFVSRRANTSGTQKTYEAVIARTGNTSIGGKQCQPGVDSFVSGPNANDNTAAQTLCTAANRVIRNSGSNQVLVCMNQHDAQQRGSIGVLSLEYKSNTPGNAVRFTRINGSAPTYQGVASGAYTYYGDVSLNTRLVAANGYPATIAAPGYTTFLTAFKAGFASAGTVEVINGSAQPFGPSGLMALDVIANPIPNPDFTGATARNPWSRLVGGTLNNCQAGKLAKPL